ncbi:hypothetical protein [Henriciella sp.]|uniref:hypothetical protein n=1 Tax=Henriciella sp. TaxID=1968823 RepID=UPI0026195019|nr:hypothetical protein [Henriciella sp.]
MSDETVDFGSPVREGQGWGHSLITPAKGALALVLVLGVLTLLFPIGLVRDYFNHLARNHIESAIWFDADIQQHYRLSFDVIPDMTMDLVVPWLSWLFGTWRAGALTIWLALVLPALGGIAIARTAHGRVTWLALGGFLAAFNVGMEWGFVNYVASSGLALLAFAVWMRTEPGLKRTLMFAPLGLLLALNHALAFLLFGFLAMVWELASFAEGERGARWPFLRRAATLDLPAMLPGIALIILATLGASDLPRGTADFFSLPQKAYGFSSGFYFFNSTVGFVALLGVCSLAGWLLVKRYIELPRKLTWVCAGLLLLNIVIPTSVLGIWGLHLRFVPPLVIVFFASAQFTRKAPVMARQVSGVVMFGLGTMMFLNGAVHMAQTDSKADEVRSLLSAMPRGARMLSAYDAGPGFDLPFAMHASGIAVIERSAYVPGLFTNTSPVDVALSNIEIHMPQSLPIGVGELEAAARRPSAHSENGYWSLGYADNWPERWDYLLFFKGSPSSSLDGLPVCERARSDNAILYKTGRC